MSTGEATIGMQSDFPHTNFRCHHSLIMGIANKFTECKQFNLENIQQSQLAKLGVSTNTFMLSISDINTSASASSTSSGTYVILYLATFPSLTLFIHLFNQGISATE